jgi:hypothetical protein
MLFTYLNEQISLAHKQPIETVRVSLFRSFVVVFLLISLSSPGVHSRRKRLGEKKKKEILLYMNEYFSRFWVSYSARRRLRRFARLHFEAILV